VSYLFLGFLAAAALVTVLAFLFAGDPERPETRRVGYVLLAVIALAAAAIVSQMP
jgi:hypothetical protein